MLSKMGLLGGFLTSKGFGFFFPLFPKVFDNLVHKSARLRGGEAVRTGAVWISRWVFVFVLIGCHSFSLPLKGGLVNR